MIDFRLLVKDGLHFGHQTSRWCPKMAPYIWGQRNGVHLIDISKTAFGLEQASQFLEKITAEGQSVLWVGTKKPAQEIITEAALQVDMPYVTCRWIGGTLTNNSQVAKSVTKLMHLEDVLQKAEDFTYTKKELNVFGKMVGRLGKTVGGLKNLTWPLGAVIVIDVRKEATVIKEAVSAGIPVIGLVDTNSDPTGVDFVIPGNDDSPKAIRAVVKYLVDAASKGVAVAQEREKAAREAAEADKKAKADARKAAVDKKATAKPAAKKANAPKPAAKVEAKPVAKKAEAPKLAAKVEAKPAAKKAEAPKPAAKVEAKPAAKKAEAPKADAAKVETKPAAKKVEAPKADAAKVEAKPVAKKVDAPKVEAKPAAEKKPAAKKATAKKTTADKDAA